ncbi:ABC transporter ATP-binding protein [Aquincola sp. S2]|uniref:ABC transporter ATP-binding protein n=1 Tax=Pseudaquabacterium terrae TaxID=2732868 RepID=A0ABX2EDX5_9BURK|nr:ABC transporter ATP-binding protein [Aquabacterium terrae]NRF66812.1 ABC transporter ATP-binding protein [Aquabacterium terrae]
MNDNPVIELARVSKSYSLEHRPLHRLWQQLRGHLPAGQVHHALHDVDLVVRRGEAVGIIGRNGAGKSTLLQVICGVLQPSAGTRKTNGRIAALLELGAGFNPELTGRENVRLNGPLLGLSAAQVERRLDEIIEFAGIGEYVDQPVRSYSSGMFVRLAFAMATSVEPDILVIDEALSVGDGEFARKSFERIMSLKERGATVLFCTHSMFQIESFCSRALWVHDGRVMFDGLASQAVVEYEAWQARHGASMASDGPVAHRFESAAASIGAVRLHPPPVGETWRSGLDDLVIDIEMRTDPTLPNPTLGVTLLGSDGRAVSSAGNWLDGQPLQRHADGSARTQLRFPALPLLKGRYTVSVFILCDRAINPYAAAEHVASFEVVQQDLRQGIVDLPHRWCHAQP